MFTDNLLLVNILNSLCSTIIVLNLEEIVINFGIKSDIFL